MAYNCKNPAIRRIQADVRELHRDPSDQYEAKPLEDNLFEWHFTVRGPPGTDFEGGVYHGRILLPPDYPFKPPNIVFNTPNGRFSVGTKICLSISAHHPEHWQPAWGLRLILEALISFFPTAAAGAIGGLDWNPEERRRLARESLEWKCHKCGRACDLLPEPKSGPQGTGEGTAAAGGGSRFADQIKELHMHSPPGAAAAASGAAQGAGALAAAAGAATAAAAASRGQREEQGGGGGSGGGGGGGANAGPTVAAEAAAAAEQQQEEEEEDDEERARLEREDQILTYVAAAILVAIIAVLVRKMMRHLGHLE